MFGSKSFQGKIRVLGKPLCVLLAAGLILFTGASDGLAQTTIVDFDFEEALTAMMDNPANGAASVMSGNISGQTWSLRDGLDDEIELEKIETDGAGSLSADLFTTKARFDGSLFLGFANGVTDSPGKNLAVMTVVVDPWDFVPVDVKGTRSRYRRIRKIWEKEEGRFGFGDTSSTNTTAIFRLQREVAGGFFGSDVVTLVGDAGDDDVETAIAGRTTTEPLTVELTDNKFTDIWSIRDASGAIPIVE